MQEIHIFIKHINEHYIKASININKKHEQMQCYKTKLCANILVYRTLVQNKVS